MCPESTPLPKEQEQALPTGSVATSGIASERTPLAEFLTADAYTTCVNFCCAVMKAHPKELPPLLQKKLVREAAGVIFMRSALHLAGPQATLSLNGNVLTVSLELGHMTQLVEQGII